MQRLEVSGAVRPIYESLGAKRLIFWHLLSDTAELHSSGLTGTTSRTDMKNIQITGYFFENRLHWQSEVGGGNFYKRLF